MELAKLLWYIIDMITPLSPLMTVVGIVLAILAATSTELLSPYTLALRPEVAVNVEGIV
jgi:hypothetical protein